jgi:hypothetical protein
MGLQQAKLESLPFVTAELNYLAPTPGKPRTYAFDPPPGEPKSTALPEPHNVPIFDARLIAGNLSLDREGFALVRHPTIVKDFYDDKEVRGVYYPAVEAFLKATLKADRVSSSTTPCASASMAPQMSGALVRASPPRACMSTRPTYQGSIACANIFPMKPTNS